MWKALMTKESFKIMPSHFLWKYFTFRYGDEVTKSISVQKLEISVKFKTETIKLKWATVYFSVNPIADVVSLEKLQLH